jgi:hypothetical protein
MKCNQLLEAVLCTVASVRLELNVNEQSFNC